MGRTHSPPGSRCVMSKDNVDQHRDATVTQDAVDSHGGIEGYDAVVCWGLRRSVAGRTCAHAWGAVDSSVLHDDDVVQGSPGTATRSAPGPMARRCTSSAAVAAWRACWGARPGVAMVGNSRLLSARGNMPVGAIGDLGSAGGDAVPAQGGGVAGELSVLVEAVSPVFVVIESVEEEGGPERGDEEPLLPGRQVWRGRQVRRSARSYRSGEGLVGEGMGGARQDGDGRAGG